MPTSALHFHLAPICFSPSLCSTLAATPALISLLSVIASDLIPPFHSLRISPFSISTQYLITFLLCSFLGGRRDVSTRTVQLVFNLYSAVRRHINSCHSHGFDIKRMLRLTENEGIERRNCNLLVATQIINRWLNWRKQLREQQIYQFHTKISQF